LPAKYVVVKPLLYYASFIASNPSGSHEPQHAELLFDGLELSPRTATAIRMLAILYFRPRASADIVLSAPHPETLTA
jgi:hypothetical protein